MVKATWDFREDTSLVLLMYKTGTVAATEMQRNIPDTLKHVNAFSSFFFCYKVHWII